MSLNLPSRRVLVAASSGLRTAATPQTIATSFRRPAPCCSPAAAMAATRSIQTTSVRAIDWRNLFGRNKKKKKSAEEEAAETFNLERGDTRERFRQTMTDSNIEANPLLATEMEEAEKQQAAEGGGAGGDESKAEDLFKNELGTSLVPESLQRALDPDPRSRVRWERKMVMQHVQRMLDPRGKESKKERLARTERELLHKSPAMATSTKKLMHLARQIAGKSLEDALVQMRFSKKKMSKEILWHLEEARDMAVVQRGMGLEGLRLRRRIADGKAEAVDPVQIQTKDGKWLVIDDPSRIYIEQAWVTKGPYLSVKPDYRARGRTNRMYKRSSYISVVLKEEKTRIREHGERVEKEARRAPWVHLPNRPVTAQRPYYSW